MIPSMALQAPLDMELPLILLHMRLFQRGLLRLRIQADMERIYLEV